MADYDSRPRGGRNGGYNNSRKRRFREDDDYNHSYNRGRGGHRRRYSDPPTLKLSRALLGLAESPLKKVEEEIAIIAKLVSAADGQVNKEGEGERDLVRDADVRETFLDLVLKLIVEQPFKIPFVAAAVVRLNSMQGPETAEPTVVKEVLNKTVARLNDAIKKGLWREVKLYLKFLGGCQGLFEGEGIWSVLQDLMGKAVDLQTADNEETLGPELVKIILLTIPYIMASSAMDNQERASRMIETTDIIASEPHVLHPFVDAYPSLAEAASESGLLGILQKQLQHEMETNWALLCLPRPWNASPDSDQEDPLLSAPKHVLPTVTIPETVISGPRPLYPELFFSVYGKQELETVPPVSDIASTLLRDALVDTINVLDYNRNATARFLIDLDCYFSPGTFVKRATPFDRLRDLEAGKSSWKPEDVAVDAVFSQLFQLPTPEHKLVYYHSVLTEACKIAPAAIAPSLGRAIRDLYRNVEVMDLELSYRFMDWFAHHLSNFGFTWKWTEWIDDVALPNLEPKKAFIQGSLDKEIRLSFAQRIKGTLPAPYQELITEEKEQDTPAFKYDDPETPFSSEGKEILALLRKKSPEEDIQPIIDSIQTQAVTTGQYADPIQPSTDAYMTSICYIGSKSLSHALSCIERCKDRLLTIAASPNNTGRDQIITSVMSYWSAHPGIAVNLIDKLLNYTILSPASVLSYALEANRSHDLAKAHLFEMALAAVGKVAKRVRLVVSQGSDAETITRERAALADLQVVVDKGFTALLDPASSNGSNEAVLSWTGRWQRVFARVFRVEASWYAEQGAALLEARAATANEVMADDEAVVV